MKKDEDKKRSEYKAGRQAGLSGREMFSFNPELAKDNDMDDGDELFDSSALRRDEEEDENQYKEINLDALGDDAQEVSRLYTKYVTSDRSLDIISGDFMYY